MNRENLWVRSGKFAIQIGKIAGRGLRRGWKTFGRGEQAVKFFGLNVNSTPIRFAIQGQSKWNEVNIQTLHFLGGEVHPAIANDVHKSPLICRH